MIDETLDAKAIFKVACLMDSKEARNVYLNQVCGANGGLHDRVVALLEAHDQPSDFLESPAVEALADLGLSGICGHRPEMPSTPQQPITGTLGDFRILREVGRGGMGVVYEAEEISLGRRVALKVLPFAAMLSQNHLHRFQNEARAAASLDHPNIVGVHSVGCERGVHYYAMHFIEGETLAEVIHRLRQEALGVSLQRQAQREELDAAANGERVRASEPQSMVLFDAGSESGEGDIRMEAHQNDRLTTPSQVDPSQAATTAAQGATADTDPLALLSTDGSTRAPELFRTVAKLGIQAAEALGHAHSMGVVHRDIKPSNMIVSVASSATTVRRSEQVNGDSFGAPHLWIADFGLAMTRDETNLTLSGDLLGTLRYMSPEQLQGDRHVLDHHTDIYSLGITLYELITLQPGFPSDDRQTLIHGIVEENPRPPRQLNKAVPWELETIILKAIAKEPQARYATATALADDLRCFLEDKPIQARRPSLPVRVAKWCHRNRPLAWSLSFLFLLVVIASVASMLVIRSGWLEATRRQRLEKRFQTALTRVLEANELWEAGHNNEAIQVQRDAIGILEDAENDLSQRPGYWRELGAGYLGLYEKQMSLKRHEQAEQALRKARAMWRGRPGLLNPDSAERLAESFFKQGEYLKLAGDNDAAESWILRAIALRAYQPVGEFAYVDLQPKANTPLNDMNTGLDNTLTELPRGVNSFAGVPFDIGENLIQLGGKESKDTPLEVEGIAVNKRFDKLYVLHAAQRTTMGRVAAGTLIGQYLVHYRNHHDETIPIVVCRDIGDWWSTHGWRPLSRARVGWVGSTEQAAKSGKVIRLYVCMWQNPDPETEVVSIDFVSSQTLGEPFCVAMTVETPANREIRSLHPRLEEQSR